jgi:hypothetical protein
MVGVLDKGAYSAGGQAGRYIVPRRARDATLIVHQVLPKMTKSATAWAASPTPKSTSSDFGERDERLVEADKSSDLIHAGCLIN